MKLQLIAVGTKMPKWVEEGYKEYSRRFPKDMPLELVEITAGKRGKNADTRRLTAVESKALLEAMPARGRIIALDVKGQSWSTEKLAANLENWMGDGRDVGFMIGGPDSIDPEVLNKVDTRWSLGPLTLPHPLVRVVLAEQLYRAWSLLHHHPYHRA